MKTKIKVLFAALLLVFAVIAINAKVHTEPFKKSQSFAGMSKEQKQQRIEELKHRAAVRAGNDNI